MIKKKKSKQVEEIRAIGRTLSRDGVLVTLRCYRVSSRVPHYEIVVNAHGQAAVVDVPAADEPLLSLRAEQTLDGFLASMKLRSAA
jgi:hypothetical protein